MKQGIAGVLTAAAFAVAFVVAGAAPSAADVFKLTSSAFEDNGPLAVKNAGNRPNSPNCVGENVSPPFSWENPPAGTKSYALLMLDPEGRAPQGVSHMVIYGIPAEATGFAEGELGKPSEKFVGGKSTMNLAIYAGPCTPPNVDWHHYTFTLVATDLDPKALQPGMTREELTAALKDHVKGSAGLIGRFRHPEK
jgi:Raf kinase inhibitor-like YbhB/YbcL family protein